MRKDMKELSNRVEILEQNRIQEMGGGQRREEEKDMTDRIKRMEENLEGREREKKRRNVMIKGVEVKERERREAVEKIFEGIGVKVEVKEIRKIEEGTEREGGMLLIKLENEDQKREIMGK